MYFKFWFNKLEAACGEAEEKPIQILFGVYRF
jgi:hypothetical protein